MPSSALEPQTLSLRVFVTAHLAHLATHWRVTVQATAGFGPVTSPQGAQGLTPHAGRQDQVAESIWSVLSVRSNDSSASRGTKESADWPRTSTGSAEF